MPDLPYGHDLPRGSDLRTISIAPLIERSLAKKTEGMSADTGAKPGHAPGRTAGGQPIPAAVLVPLIDRDQSPTVLLTCRSPHLSAHAGQIGFPGGRIDRGESAEQAAVREAGEEVGIPAGQIRMVGQLEPYLTVTGYLIDPFVAWIEPPHRFVANPGEVGEIFEVPLSVILRPGAFKKETVTVKGRQRSYYSLQHEDYYIWGATAGMLISFRNRLDPSCAS